MPFAIWEAIYPHVRKLERAKTPFELWINGTQKSLQQIHRALRLAIKKRPDLASATPRELPQGVIIRTVNRPQVDFASLQLPVIALYTCIRSGTAVDPRRSRYGGLSPELCDNNGPTALSANAPQPPPAWNISVPTGRVPRMLTSPMLRNIIYLMSNNFPGLNLQFPQRVLELVELETAETLFAKLRFNAHLYSAQAFGLNIFRAAIEVGNCGIVDTLLRTSLIHIGVDRLVCCINGRRYTAVERAAALYHGDVVKVLLSHGADINFSIMDPHGDHGGALNFCASALKSALTKGRIRRLLDQRLPTFSGSCYMSWLKQAVK